MQLYSYRILSTKPKPLGLDDYDPKDGLLIEVVIVPTDKIGSPEEESISTKTTILVACVRTRRSTWSYKNPALADDDNMVKVLYEFGKRHLEEKLQTGEEITERLRLELHSNNTPDSCPYDPARITINLNEWSEQIEAKRPLGF